MNQAEQEHIHPKDAVKLLLQAIQIADRNDDVELGYELRSNLMDMEWGLADRKEFVTAFSWMLNAFDANPHNFSAEDLLWKYKWIIDEVYANPEMALEQVDEIVTDFKRRTEAHGYGLRSYYAKLLNEALYQEDLEQSKHYLDQMNAMPIDDLSDCRACEMDADVSYIIMRGDFDAAYAKAGPLLQKQVSCGHVPVVTICNLCYMAIKNGEREMADRLFLRAEEELIQAEHDTTLINSIGLLIVYLFYTDKSQGWAYLEKYVSWALGIKPSLQMLFAISVTEALQQENLGGVVVLELSPEHPLYNSSNSYLVMELFEYYHEEALALSSAFDQRNGNRNYRLQLERGLSQSLYNTSL